MCVEWSRQVGQEMVFAAAMDLGERILRARAAARCMGSVSKMSGAACHQVYTGVSPLASMGADWVPHGYGLVE